MKTNLKNRNHTLDLFTANAGVPDGTPDPTSATAAGQLEGDGLPDATRPEAAQPEAALPASTLPALADVELHRTEPFRVPGLKSLVLPVPVFRVKLVREGDHLTRMVQSPADAARLCSEMLDGYDREVFLVLALSTANRLIGAHVCHVGTVDASIASPREVFKFALLVNARSVIVAHNHPSGNLEPSRADVTVSKQLKAAGEVLGVRLLDSFVVGFDGRYTSLSERGLL